MSAHSDLITAHAAIAMPATPVIWVHLTRVQQMLPITSIAQRLAKAYGEMRVVITTSEALSKELPPLPEGFFVQDTPLDKRGDARNFLAETKPVLCLWCGGLFQPTLLNEWARIGGKTLLLEAEAALLKPASGLAWPGFLRRLLTGFAHHWPVDEATCERLEAFGVSKQNITEQGRLQIAPPIPHLDAARLDETATRLEGRQLWCAVHPTIDDLMRVKPTHLAARALDHRLLLGIVPRPALRRETLSWMQDNLPSPLSSEITSFDSRTAAFTIDDLDEAPFWQRLALLAVLGGSFDPDANMVDPIAVVQSGVPLAAGPHRDPYEMAISSLDEIGAALLLPNKTEFSKLLLEAMQPAQAAKRSSLAWERLTRGARASDDLIEHILTVLDEVII